MGLLLAFVPNTVHAQTTFPSRPTDSLFQRQTLPSECLIAAKRLVIGDGWVSIPDTLSYDPDRMPSPHAQAALRQCKAHIDPNAVPSELIQMYELSVRLGEVDSAWYYLARARAQLPAIGTSPLASGLHAQFLADAISVMLHTPPSRPEPVDRLMRSLDSVPKDTFRFQIGAYAQRFATAAARNDRARMHRTFDGLVANFRDWVSRVPADHRYMWEMRQRVSDAISMLAEQDWIDQGLPAARAAMQQRAAAAFGATAGEVLERNVVFGTHPPPVGDSGMTRGPKGQMVWTPLPRDRVTLLVFVPDCDSKDFGYCATVYATIRRLYRQYGHAVPFVLVSGTAESLKGELIQDPAKERAARADYFLNELELPGQLVVVENQFKRKPDPDRRVEFVSNPIGKWYGKPATYLPLGNMMVMDRSGVLSAMHLIAPTSERAVHALLDRLLE
jgi:hypothetical protein